MTENATTLGLAVQGYLTRPLLTSDPAVAMPLETRLGALRAEVEHLRGKGLVSDDQHRALLAAVPVGAVPEAVGDPRGAHPVGTVLITTARRYQPHVSAAHDVVAALGAVTSAAIAGFAHSGPLAALACASVASVRAIADGHKQDGHKQSGHKQSAGHKR
ncbi:hypothetical protein [Saccharothrix syringae]|uniref:Uncharacterized protein n=1 Tax=Saccharothrix syringae TaxID=103733 RepID=A0A5Q0H492_SACSY|nr:hypothetical protein [Saccharothrix syringae]QFZ21041.1 hypothetical protein EKG83_29935 [Saccharothrix syringae]